MLNSRETAPFRALEVGQRNPRALGDLVRADVLVAVLDRKLGERYERARMLVVGGRPVAEGEAAGGAHAWPAPSGVSPSSRSAISRPRNGRTIVYMRDGTRSGRDVARSAAISRRTTSLNVLADRATYFYSGAGKWWYDTQANITRRAKDAAEALHEQDVWAEIVKRLDDKEGDRGAFAGIHIGPGDSACRRDRSPACT